MKPPDNVIINYEKMSLIIWGFVYADSNSLIHIIINDRLVPEIQQQVYLHELYHIKHDLNKKSRIIGVNHQHCNFENEAEMFAEVAAAKTEGG